MIVSMKQCSKCKVMKSLGCFNRHPASKSGLHPRCKVCRKADHADDYIKHKNQINRKNRENYNRIKNTPEYKEYKKSYHLLRPDPISLCNKFCLSCEAEKAIDQFGVRKGSKDGYREYCYDCRKNLAKSDYLRHKDRYIWNARARQTGLKQACPVWLTKEQRIQLTEIYNNCPKGYDVDHIIPLKGKTVCGLHVPWNLRYLPELLNGRKYNKLVVY